LHYSTAWKSHATTYELRVVSALEKELDQLRARIKELQQHDRCLWRPHNALRRRVVRAELKALRVQAHELSVARQDRVSRIYERQRYKARYAKQKQARLAGMSRQQREIADDAGQAASAAGSGPDQIG